MCLDNWAIFWFEICIHTYYQKKNLIIDVLKIRTMLILSQVSLSSIVMMMKLWQFLIVVLGLLWYQKYKSHLDICLKVCRRFNHSVTTFFCLICTLYNFSTFYIHYNNFHFIQINSHLKLSKKTFMLSLLLTESML